MCNYNFNLYCVKVVMLKNEVNLLQIKSKNQESTINIKNREVEDLNLEYTNELEQIKKELINNQHLINHYKGNILF